MRARFAMQDAALCQLQHGGFYARTTAQREQ
jgi:hypothetical protein